MKFTKMHGLGNDYLYVYDTQDPKDPGELSRQLSDRHFGAGSDGMIWILPSNVADFKMRIFNADGSEAMMCGNGIRCVGKYVYDKGYTRKTTLTIETLSGIKTLDLKVVNGKVSTVSIDMGKAKVCPSAMLHLEQTEITYQPVSMGNPHAVIFVEDASLAPLTTLGPRIEHHPRFQDGVNVEFVQVINEHTLRMRVWERGSGVTLACGTGACASTAAAIAAGYCTFNQPIEVQLDGGSLLITINDHWDVHMQGPATTIYEGEVNEDA